MNSVKDQKLIEGVLQRATRMVPEIKELAYEKWLKDLDLFSMRYIQVRGDMIEVYKFTHEMYSMHADILQRDYQTRTRGHQYKLKKRYSRTATTHNFFSLRVASRCNNLPENVVSARSLASFKIRLDDAWQNYHFSTEAVPPTRF